MEAARGQQIPQRLKPFRNHEQYGTVNLVIRRFAQAKRRNLLLARRNCPAGEQQIPPFGRNDKAGRLLQALYVLRNGLRIVPGYSGDGFLVGSLLGIFSLGEQIDDLIGGKGGSL